MKPITMPLVILMLKLSECPTLFRILCWGLCYSTASGREVHRLGAFSYHLLGFFLFLLVTVGHTVLSTGVELLAIRTAAIPPAFNRCAANKSPFSFLATLAGLLIHRSQELNNDCFNQTLVVRVSFIQIISCFKKEILSPEYWLYNIVSQSLAKVVTGFVV